MVTSLVKLSASGAGCEIGFRTAGRVVAHGHGESESIADLHLQALLPGTRVTTIAATRICQQQEFVFGGIARPSFGVPPGSNGVGREGGSVPGFAQVDQASIGRDVVHPVGHRPPVGITGKVVDIDHSRLTDPGLASVLEVAHEFLFLRVDAQDRQASSGKRGALHRDVIKLLLAVGVVRRGFALLGVDVQRIIQILQQACYGRRAHRMANGFQSITQAAQAAAYPDLAGHRVARRFGFDQLLQGGDDGQGLFFVRGRPPPGTRTRSTGRSTSEAANSWRPRRIVFSSTPVISNRIRSAPYPSRSDSTARYQRRCCSSSRLSNRFIRRWYSRSGCSSPKPHSAHWQDRTIPVGTLRSPLWLSPKLLRLRYSHCVPTGRGLTKTGSCSFTAPKLRKAGP